jgi:hypothetical protein
VQAGPKSGEDWNDSKQSLPFPFLVTLPIVGIFPDLEMVALPCWRSGGDERVLRAGGAVRTRATQARTRARARRATPACLSPPRPPRACIW